MFDKNLLLNHIMNEDPSRDPMIQRSRQTNERAKQLHGLFQDVFNIPFTANSGMHFVNHYAEHPVHGKLYVGSNGRITNNPKKAKAQGYGSEVTGDAGRTDRIPLQPRFNIDGKPVEYKSDLHNNLAGWLRENPAIRVEPRLTFDHETTEKLANAENARQAERNIMNKRPTIKVRPRKENGNDV